MQTSSRTSRKGTGVQTARLPVKTPPKGRTLQEVRIFLASPGDVRRERKYAEEVVGELNRTIAPRLHLALRLVCWEHDAYPGHGKDAQHVLNPQIGWMSRYALFVGVMWNRIGTPTKRAKSGTLEEYSRALTARRRTGRPEIWCYFRDYAKQLTTPGELAQRQEVLKFRARVSTKAYAPNYTTPARFKDMFRSQLTLWLQNGRRSAVKPRAAKRTTVGGASGLKGHGGRGKSSSG